MALCFVDPADAIRAIGDSIGREARRQLLGEAVRAWVDEIPDSELEVHYAKALSELDEHDLSIRRSARWSSRSPSASTRCERAHIRSGDKVLVVGAGPVGLSVIAWAARSRRERAGGVRPVGACDATRPRSSAPPAPSIPRPSRSSRATTWSSSASGFPA